jgi:hypothetical protein
MPRTSGWQQLVAGWPRFRGEGSYPLPAYSEFLPPPQLGRKHYGAAVSAIESVARAATEEFPG